MKIALPIVLACGMSALSSVWPAPTAAQTPAATSETVTMGASGVIARDPQIKVTVPPKRGSTALVTETAPQARDVLLYYAPQADKEYGDELKYTSANGSEKTVKIAVRSAPTLASGELYSESFKALFTLFVLAVLVESALALIFRWRPYLDYVNSRGLNALVAVAVSYALVAGFNLDITTTLMNIYTGSNFASGRMGQLLTAFIIAGGSAGVNNVLRSLGFREIARPEAEVAKPPPAMAWVSVTHEKGDADGPVDVVISTDGEPAVARSMPASAGSGWWARNFLRDKGRFPPSGGHVLAPGKRYEVFLQGEGTKDGKRMKVRSETWGPHDVVPGAVIDLRLKPRFVDG